MTDPVAPTSPVSRGAAAASAAPVQDAHRWWALAVVALAQLMVVLDSTIVNVALPSAQRDLGLTMGSRQWVVTAYMLAFGGLLLLGGRIADLLGRKRVFVAGLVGFAIASAVGGAAPGPGTLFAGRALQGLFAAVLAPSAMSLLTTTFTDGKERSKAFGIFGAISGAGGALGVLLGGVITGYLSWRWCLYVNVGIAAVAAVGAVALLKDRAGHREAHLDVPGVLLGCGGLLALVLGVSRAESDGWGSAPTLVPVLGGVVLLCLFVVWQRRAPYPLLPPRILAERNRGGAILAMCLAAPGLFGMSLFMTYYLQSVLDYSAVRTGVAMLPLSVGIITGSTQISARLLHHAPPRMLMAPGLVLAAAGLYVLTLISPHSGYFTHVLPGMFFVGLGLGLVFMPGFSTATTGVAPRDAGVTSASVNTAQQVGGSIGTALLNTVASTVTASYVADRLTGHGAVSAARRSAVADAGAVHGFRVALGWACLITLAAAVITLLLVNARPRTSGTQEPEPASSPAA